MKSIYKVLISVFTILMLFTIANAARPTPIPTSTPTPDLLEARVAALEANMGILQTQVSTLQTQVNNLTNRYNGVYGSPVVLNDITTTDWMKLQTYSFYLPQNSYVYINSLTSFYDAQYYAGTEFIVDSASPVPTEGCTAGCAFVGDGSPEQLFGQVQLANVLYLSAGSHTVDLYGTVYGLQYSGQIWSGINVIASTSGSGNSASIAEKITISTVMPLRPK